MINYEKLLDLVKEECDCRNCEHAREPFGCADCRYNQLMTALEALVGPKTYQFALVSPNGLMVDWVSAENVGEAYGRLKDLYHFSEDHRIINLTESILNL